MKITVRMAVIATAAFAASLTLAGETVAQGGMGPGKGGGIYDPKTVETVSGEIVNVEAIQHGGRAGGGIHLTVKTAKETISVHVGPAWYVDKQALKLAAKDQIEVRGSRVTYDGKPAIIAAAIKKGDQTLELRDAGGLPLWRGQGRRAR